MKKISKLIQTIFFIMLIAIIPLDLCIKYLHQKFYEIPMYITYFLLIIYGVVALMYIIGIIIYYIKLKKFPHVSSDFKKSTLVMCIVIVAYFAVFRQPIGLSNGYFSVDNIVIEESVDHHYVNGIVVENKWELFNSLKYAKHKMDYDYGFTEGLGGKYRIVINYKNNIQPDYFYYNQDLDIVTCAVTNYKVLNYYSDKLIKIISSEVER